MTPAARNIVAQQEEGRELEAIERFDVQLAVTGSYSRGGSLSVRATASANVPTAEAEIAIRIPQLALIGLGGAAPVSPVGRPITPVGRQVGSLAAQAPRTVAAAVVFPLPGYYEIIASVVKQSDEPNELDGKVVLSANHKSVWVYVDEDGGRMTESYDPSVLPLTWIRGPGPARYKGRAAPRSSGDSASPSVMSMSSYPGNRQAVYYNADTGTYDPVPNVTVYWMIFDTIDHSHYGASSTVTDANGYWQAPCLYLNQYTDTEFRFWNVDFDLQPAASGYGEWEFSGCSDDLVVNELPRSQSHVFRNMQVIIPAAKVFFSPWTRGQVQVVVSASAPISKYERSPDRITISTVSNAAVFNGSDGYGGFTQAHEYGHAFHHKALGGIVDNGGPCPDSHTLYGPTTLGCAFREGFADYFAVAVFPNGVGGSSSSFLSKLESNADFTGGDGSIIEGAFAAFLLDLTDPVSEFKDAVQFPGGYVAHTVKSCEVDDYSWPFPIRANGPDHFVFCFERTVDTSLWPTFFATRGGPTQTVSPVAPAPFGWSQGPIRTNWLWNMYKQ